MRYRPQPTNTTNSESKPRVLVVDDHPEMLLSVSKMLTTDFDVVGVATDGQAALESVRQAEPDLIVMDVAMPRLDGFQAVRALRRTPSQAKVVFLSMHESDEYVVEAFESGGQGFVLKTRVQADLASALHQVLAGRLFVPSLKSLFHVADGGSGHAMQLHRHSDGFLDGVCEFFHLALQRGDATCLIGTEPVRAAVGARLRERGWDLDGSAAGARHLVVDAAEAIDRFMRGDSPDPERLAEIADELEDYRRTKAEGPLSRLTVFGEMASVLSLRGNSAASIEVERNWTRLTHHLPHFTLCAYSTDCFDDEMHADLFSSVCAEHWAVSHA